MILVASETSFLHLFLLPMRGYVVSYNLPGMLFPSPKTRATEHATSINSHGLVSKRKLILVEIDYSFQVKSGYIFHKLQLSVYL